MPPLLPMLAKSTPELPDAQPGAFWFEPKWDGFRCIVFRDGDEIELGSRNDRPLTRYFPELLEPLKASLPERCVVDGEVALRATARAAEPLALVLEVAKPRPTDISVHVSSKSIRGEIVRIIGGVDAEIRRFTAAHVCDQIDSPESKAAQVIHVADMIDETWTGI